MSELTVRRLSTRIELEACVALEQQTWQYGAGELLPWRVFFLADKLGGHVIGAYDGNVLVGFNLGLPAQRNGIGYIHSQMLAVLQEYRNTGIGRRMKLLQRDIALQQQIRCIQWTYDPLEIKNSFFNLHRLGAISRAYYSDFYGESTSPLQGGLPTDRLVAEWWIASDRVERMLRGEDFKAETRAVVSVPGEIYTWKTQRDVRARQTQEAVRSALLQDFAQGLVVVDYQCKSDGSGTFVLADLPSELIEETARMAQRNL